MLLLAAWGAALGRTSLRAPSRALLTMLCLALGVTLFSSVQRVSDVTLRSFERAQVLSSGRSDLVVHAGEVGVDASIFDKLATVPGFVFAIPRVKARSFVASGESATETLTVFGLDLFRERFVLPNSSRSWVVDGNLKDVQHGEDVIAVVPRFAERHGLGVGSSVALGTAHGVQDFRVGAIIDPQGPLSVLGSSIAVLSLKGGQRHFSRPGRFDRIEVMLEPDADTGAARAAIRQAVGPGFTVESSLRRSQLFEGMSRSFRLALSLCGFVALAVAVLVASGALSFQVMLQRSDIALRRAIGASRRQVLVSIVGEGLVLGFVAALVGLVLGNEVSNQLTALVQQTLLGQYRVALEMEPVEFQWGQALDAVGIGVGAALVASLPAAWRAASIAPVQALRDGPERSTRRRRRLTLLAVACLVYASVSLFRGWFAVHPLLAIAEAVSAIFGTAWLAPSVVAASARAARRLISGEGSPNVALLDLALGNLARMSRSTTNAVRLLVVPLAFSILLGVVNRSLEHSIYRALSHTLRGDLVVTSLGQVIANWSQPMHEDIRAQLMEVPGVSRVAGTRFVSWRFAGANGETEIGIKAFDPSLDDEPLFALHDLSFETARRRMFDRGEVLVSQSFRARHGTGPGAELQLDTPSGSRRFVVAGIVDDYAHPGGVVYLSRARYEELWQDPLVTQFRVATASDVSADTVSTRITRELGQRLGVRVLQPRELRAVVESSVGQSFAFVRALEGVALLVALLGTAGACALGLIDRKRELSLLRAVGLTRLELKALLSLELLLSGFVTALYAAVVGAVLGGLWAAFPLAEVLGWQVSVAYPWARIAVALAVGSLGMLAAGLLPIAGLDRRLAPAPA